MLFLLASVELIKQFQNNNNYIERKGIHNIVRDKETDIVIQAYVESIKWGMSKDKDVPFSLEISKKTKNLIDALVCESTNGWHIPDLEVYCGENSTNFKTLDSYYEVLRCESPYLVDSFFSYIEIDEKDPFKRFYFPRRKVLQPVVGAYQEVYDGKLDFLSVSQPKRTGKMLLNDELIATPNGFVKNGSLKVGDYVISASGKPTKVIGVYPHKGKRIYEVIISESGKSKQETIIRCGADHLWEVSTEDSRYKNKPNRVMSTIELMNGVLKRGKDMHNNYAIDYVKPVEFESSAVSVDPWLLGILIGDGSLSGENLCVSNTERDILQRIADAVAQYGTKLVSKGNNKDYALSCGELRARLRELSLIGKKSEEKFIPKDYLFNSVEVRTKLLQGLCDADGFTESGGVEYCTTSKQLAEDIIFLVKSLGGKASSKLKHTHYTRNGARYVANDAYRIYINFPKGEITPVSSEKHLKKYNPQRTKLYHFISGIRETNDFADMTCIEVEDESHLYCATENFILTHNTTGGLRLAMMMGGREPDGSIFGVGKGEGLVKRFYGGLLQGFETESIYNRFLTVFPEAVKIGEKDYKSAENLSIDLKSKNIFPTFTCRPIDGAIVGCTEANVLVYIDDCVKNHEEARNRDRLEFLCEKVTDDVLGRRLEGTPIIIQGTKYSLYDPITALQNKADELGWRWREVAVPALDPITDESNWEIYRKDKKGLRKIFTTDYYRKERKLVSEETWAAEFQQDPYEAKGRMFAESELNYFEELPVDREPDAIMAACDSADKGDDSCAMPVGYVYGNEVYIVDVVFDNAGTQFTKPECANMLIKHNVKTVTFESNSAGEYFGRDVMDIVKEQGGRCSARFKFNCTNKITRMENARDNIIRDYYFRDFKKMDRQSQYYKFMKELTTMTRSGKVPHDDAPDSIALFENEMRSGVVRTASIISSPI